MTFREVNERVERIQSPVPVWLLNGKISSQQIDKEFELIANKGIDRIIICPRKGLDRVYLSEDWFDLLDICIKLAKKHGLIIWMRSTSEIGLQASEVGHHFCSKYLQCDLIPIAEVKNGLMDLPDYVVAANIVEGSITKTKVIESAVDLSRLSDGWHIFTFTKQHDPDHIDSLSQEAVEYLCNTSYEQYYKRFGEEFGKTVEAVFADQPAVYQIGYDDWNIPYTDDFFQTYQQKYADNPIAKLPYLFYEGRQAKEFRAQFWTHAGELFKQRYHSTLRDWCRQHSLLYSGHNSHQEPLRYQIRYQGDMFGSMAAMDIPGVDHVDKQTLGNYWISILGNKICSSQAHISGKARCISKSFGNVDWDADYINLKQIVDWQYGLGINLLSVHALFHTIAGQQKRNRPPSFFYQSSLWEDFDCFGEYVQNLEKMLVGGRHVCRVAVFYPLSGLCAEYQTDRKTNEFEHIESFLNLLCLALIKNHVDFDLIDRESLQQAEYADGKINLAGEHYECLLIPVVEYLADADVALIMKAFGSGVQTTMFFRSMEPHEHNNPSEDRRAITPVRSEEVQNYVRLLARSLNDDIELSGGGAEDILLYRREKDGKRLYFLVNRSAKHRKISVVLAGHSEYAIYCPENDTFEAATGRKTGLKTAIQLKLEPYRSVFLVEGQHGQPIDTRNGAQSIVLQDFHVSIDRNVALLFDFDCTDSDGNIKHLDVRDNPRISTEDCRYAASYQTSFDIECSIGGICLVLDADYADCRIEVNGNAVELQPCTSEDGKSLHRYLTDWSDVWADGAALLRHGKNTVQIFSPNRISEPFRLVGRFAVSNRDGIKLTDMDEIDPFEVESACPFFSGTIRYTATFQSVAGRHILDLYNAMGAVQVLVNGVEVGRRLWGPYQLHISAEIVTGTNKLEIMVRNSMANLIKGEHRAFGLRRMPELTYIGDTQLFG